MKTERYFLSIMLTLSALFFSQTASAAYIKYTYQTPIMTASEEQTYDENGYPPGSGDFFWEAKEQFDITFIIPELEYELEEMEVFYTVIENTVVNITAANFFNNITINSSNFAFETWKEDGYITQNWWLTIDITDSNFPNNMERRASILIDNYGSYMTFYQDNYYTRRCAGQYPPEWEMGCWSGTYNSVVDFYGYRTGEYPDGSQGGIKGLIGERVSVSEPLSPMLLLIGLAVLFFARRITFKSKRRSIALVN